MRPCPRAKWIYLARVSCSHSVAHSKIDDLVTCLICFNKTNAIQEGKPRKNYYKYCYYYLEDIDHPWTQREGRLFKTKPTGVRDELPSRGRAVTRHIFHPRKSTPSSRLSSGSYCLKCQRKCDSPRHFASILNMGLTKQVGGSFVRFTNLFLYWCRALQMNEVEPCASASRLDALY